MSLTDPNLNLIFTKEFLDLTPIFNSGEQLCCVLEREILYTSVEPDVIILAASRIRPRKDEINNKFIIVMH